MLYGNRIAVTGVGGGVGQSILKCLQGSGYELIALDGESTAPGLYIANEGYTIPYASADSFIPALLQLCQEKSISLLFPGLDAELSKFAEHREEFRRCGTEVVVSRPDVIRIADDKLQTVEFLRGNGLGAPETQLATASTLRSVKLPVVVKQRVAGARSKNVYLVRDDLQLSKVKSIVETSQDAYVIQEYIEGSEYTCGSVSLDGRCEGVIVMRRILRDGDTHKCFSEENLVVEAYVKRIINALKPFGACNIQLRVRNDTPLAFEVNARCSGTTAARAACGFNEPLAIANYLMQGISTQLASQSVSILRYWNELIVPNMEIEEVRSTGGIRRGIRRLL